MFNPPYLPIPDAPRTVYGNSGCIVRTRPDNTTKISNSAETADRLHSQGLFLETYGSGRSILPKVFRASAASCMMETLNPVDWQNIDPVTVMEELESKLSHQLWCIPAVVETGWHIRLSKYIEQKLKSLVGDTSADPLSPITAKKVMELVEQLASFEAHGSSPDLETRVIHGDPTLDN